MDIAQELAGINSKTDRLIEAAMQSLNELIRLTEEKYAYVYQTLPIIEEDVGMNMEEIEILLRYLVYRQPEQSINTGRDPGNLSGAENSVTIQGLLRIQREFEEVTNSFLDKDLINLLMSTFLNQSAKDDQRFNEMGRLVREVQDSLAGLRDLALNSMIFSIRVGEEGAGFQILSDRINQISATLGQEFRRMDQVMEGLDAWNQRFQKLLVDFVHYEEELRTKYQDKFSGEFAGIQETLRVICSLLTDHLNNVQTVVTKVPEAMVAIQNQDIIRQNIENLIKCLQIVLDKQRSLKETSPEPVLNYLAFAKKVAELGDSLLNNIETGLEESIGLMEGVLAGIDSQAGDLAEETAALGRFFAGTTKDEETSLLNTVLTTILSQVDDLLYIKSELETKSSFLLEERENFLSLMVKVEQHFSAIDREIRTLRKMRVLIKIELSRITKGDNSIQSIAGAVDEVIETVHSNQAAFNKLRDYFVKNVDQFKCGIDKTKQKLDQAAEELELSKVKLTKAGRLVIGAVRAMCSELGGIYSELQKPYAGMQIRGQVREMIDLIRSNLQTYAQIVTGKEPEFLGHFGLTKWEENEEDLKTLIEQFTCFVERQSATAVFEEFDADLGTHSSDIVLF